MNPLIIIPTYNERNNVTPISSKILELSVPLDILFVDDNSPDGTGAVLDGISAANPSVTVLHRKKKDGIGTAHVAGLRWARERGYDTVVTMDCDLTHSPEDIPRLLESTRFADVIVGSRYLRAGSLRGWNVRRKLLTRIAHLLTRFFLAIPYDATGAFRAYRLDRLPADIFEIVRSKTYPFFFESLFVMHANGIAVLEIPIDLPPRTYGSSKMPASEPFHGIRYLLELAILRKICPEAFLSSSRVVEADPALEDDQGWDIYWSDGTGAGSLLYRILATLYRRAIIAGRLSAMIRRTFAPDSKLLHAGCGSGQVDVSFQNEMRITAVDSSLRALNTYVRTVPHAKSVKHASIAALPYEPASFDGIYNLGVMEHFPENEIVAIAREFRRVLRPEGRLLLFWPHARATSVAVLRLWHSLRSLHSRTNVPLHPPEVSLVRSKKWLAELLGKAGFELEFYEFDWKDFWVQAVVIARPSP
ncbi:MAG: glycosyltransferase [Terrimicrobiaceae bacterium]